MLFAFFFDSLCLKGTYIIFLIQTHQLQMYLFINSLFYKIMVLNREDLLFLKQYRNLGKIAEHFKMIVILKIFVTPQKFYFYAS